MRNGRFLSLLMCLAAFLLIGVAPAGASASCEKVASPTGSDTAAGTAAAPYRTAQKVADSLSAGQTGCFRSGIYAANDVIRVSRSGITLTSYPGERATLRGRLYIVRGANGVTIADLDLDGRNSASAPGVAVNAADTVFRGLDVTNYNDEICFVLGNADFGRAVRTIIENSRIHNCGILPATNQDHGIYVDNADGTIIRNNWIYDNADRGVQIYPDAQGTQVYRNVIDGNGEGIVISGDGLTASSDSDVHHNVISNSKMRWNVESAWPGGLVGRNNRVHDNCMWASSSRAYYNLNGGIIPLTEGIQGFTESGNVTASPKFVDHANKNFSLAAGSPCAFVFGEPAPAPAEPPAPTPVEEPAPAEPAPTAPVVEPTPSEPVPTTPTEPTPTEPTPTEPAPAPVVEPTPTEPAPAPVVAEPVTTDGTVVIKPRRRRGSRSSKVAVTGWARGADGSSTVRRYATVSVKRDGIWKTFARVRVLENGHFAVGRLIQPSRGARSVRIRAEVSGIGSSRPVTVRV